MAPTLRVTGLAVALATASVVVAPTAGAVSSDVVISEVYGGGGNSGATYRNDFVELRNNGSAAVSVAGWSVQYASASGTSWLRTALTGSVPAGGSYLVQLYGGSTTGAALPTPDVTGTTNLSATSGKVALVTNNTTLACGSNCDAAAGVKDFVGYGTANDYETAPAPAGSNTTSPTRSGPDTDNNRADFTAAAPTPGSSSGGGTPPPAPSCPGTRIHSVQRASHTGLTGSVSGLPGVVTATSTSGFWMQEVDSCVDSDPATSEGIYVAKSAGPAVGTSVTVSGTVAEV
ncbi:MAG: nuclease, partial [Dermatophilaceae bacterium]|nr:nuclease [Dermatophilaceae bacterium]